MSSETQGGNAGNERIYALIEGSPKEGASPTIWAWPQITEYFKVAGQPVQGPWPPHQHPRPDPDADNEPTAIPDSRGVQPASSIPPDDSTEV